MLTRKGGVFLGASSRQKLRSVLMFCLGECAWGHQPFEGSPNEVGLSGHWNILGAGFICGAASGQDLRAGAFEIPQRRTIPSPEAVRKGIEQEQALKMQDSCHHLSINVLTRSTSDSGPRFPAPGPEDGCRLCQALEGFQRSWRRKQDVKSRCLGMLPGKGTVQKLVMAGVIHI